MEEKIFFYSTAQKVCVQKPIRGIVSVFATELAKQNCPSQGKVQRWLWRGPIITLRPKMATSRLCLFKKVLWPSIAFHEKCVSPYQ